MNWWPTAPILSRIRRMSELISCVQSFPSYALCKPRSTTGSQISCFCASVGSQKALHCPSQRLSHWLVDVITQAYKGAGRPVPEGVRCHSTRSVTTSWATLRGVPLKYTQLLPGCRPARCQDFTRSTSHPATPWALPFFQWHWCINQRLVLLLRG